MNRRYRPLILLVVGLVPWTVILTGSFLSLVFPLWWFDPGTASLTTVWDYVFVYTRGLPGYLLAWPVGTVLYLGAVASAAVGALTGREDRRVTALLLAFAGLSQLSMALGFLRRPAYLAVPLGSVLCLGVAWWYGRPAFRTSAWLSPD